MELDNSHGNPHVYFIPYSFNDLKLMESFLYMVTIINKTVHEGNATNWLLMLHQIKDATVRLKIVIKYYRMPHLNQN